jgi:hypothetical protein
VSAYAWVASAVIGVLLAQAPPHGSESVDRVSGNPSLRAAVDARTRRIYDAATRPESRRRFLQTTENLLGAADAVGTEATLAQSPTAGARIVATTWTRQGKYSVEYYCSPTGALLFTYETLTYFAETSPPDAWRNFMGLAAWERRSYFDGHQEIGYAESRGRQAPTPGAGATELREGANRLAKALAATPSASHSPS